MSDTTYDPADPRLTAYALGELDEAERRQVELQLEQCAESRAAVEEIRETVGLVTSALAAEPVSTLTAEQRSRITQEAAAPAAPQQTRHTTWRATAASFIAGVIATAAIILLVLPQLHRRPANDVTPALNGENSIIATTSSSPKFGDDDFSYTLESELSDIRADQNSRDPSVSAAAISTGPVAGGLGRSARSSTSQLSAAEEDESGQPGWKLAYNARRKSGRMQTNQPPPRPTTGTQPKRPAGQSMAAGSSSLSSVQDLERVDKAIKSRLRSVTKAGGKEKEIRTGTERGDDLNRGPTTALASKLSTNNSRNKSIVAPGYLADPSRITRNKTRVAGRGIFERPAGGESIAKNWHPDLNIQFGMAATGGKNGTKRVDNSKKQAGAPTIFERIGVDYDFNVQDGEPANEQYQPIIENPFLSPNNDPLSTFSIDVDTASYSNVRRFLKQNQFPPPNAVRIEELVNYFHYDYPEPADGQPFSVNLEAGPCPWNSEHRLVRVGLKGKEIDKSQRPPSNLVFLLDVSGSMRDANKLPLVKTAMEMLVSEMTEDDRIAIVTYAGKAGLKLPSTSGQDKTRIIDAIHALSAGGSTNGEAGIKLAYEQAVGHFIDDGANRVILCTDGDFNVGTSGDKELVTLIQEQAKSKVFLSVFGFGMGNLKDGKLEQIADKGNGQYGYIDNEREAHKVFVEEMVGTLYTIAKDVKIQVEFNPQQVGGYRLIGYENRMLAAKDFNDDTKDAGEIGAGHTVTALYEIVPFDKLPAKQPVDNLKYQKQVKVNDDDKVAKELLTVKLRYKQPDAEQSTKIDFTLTDNKPHTEMPSVDFEWAASCAGFGLLLRNSQYRGQADFDLIRELAMGSRGDDESGRRREFLDLVFTAHALHARATGQPIPPRESLPEDKAREMAAVEGKYRNLLKKIAIPTDAATYGQFTDFGYWAGNAWGNHKDLPKGHWVYVAPHWYIWGDSTAKKSSLGENK